MILCFQCEDLSKILLFIQIGSLNDLVKWYGINYAGTQLTQSDFQNKGRSGWTVKSAFVLEVPLRFGFASQQNLFRTM